MSKQVDDYFWTKIKENYHINDSKFSLVWEYFESVNVDGKVDRTKTVHTCSK
jgi:hypothetical protein